MKWTSKRKAGCDSGWHNHVTWILRLDASFDVLAILCTDSDRAAIPAVANNDVVSLLQHLEYSVSPT